MAGSLQGVVGIHQEYAVGRHHLCISFEGGEFIGKDHYPAMGVGAAERYIVVASRPDVARSVASPEVGRSRGGESPVQSLRPPQPELQYRVAARRSLDAGGFGGDQGGEIHHRQQGGFQQLYLQQRAFNTEQRLVGQHDLPFRHGVDTAGPLHALQVIEEGFAKKRTAVTTLQSAEILYIIDTEPEVFDQVDGQGQARGEGEVAIEGRRPVEKVKNSLPLVHALIVVARRHREFVQVGQ